MGCYNMAMSNKNIFIGVIVLIAGVIATHFLDANYYHKQVNKAYTDSVSTENNMGADFSAALGLTTGKLDCTQFKDNANVTYCGQINQVR
jgi:hypothetical protein